MSISKERRRSFTAFAMLSFIAMFPVVNSLADGGAGFVDHDSTVREEKDESPGGRTLAPESSGKVTYTVHACTCNATATCGEDSSIEASVTSVPHAPFSSISEKEAKKKCKEHLILQLGGLCIGYGDLVLTEAQNCTKSQQSSRPIEENQQWKEKELKIKKMVEEMNEHQRKYDERKKKEAEQSKASEVEKNKATEIGKKVNAIHQAHSACIEKCQEEHDRCMDGCNGFGNDTPAFIRCIAERCRGPRAACDRTCKRTRDNALESLRSELKSSGAAK